MQINQQIISGFIESGLNWLTEQVAGRIDTSKLTPQGQPQFNLVDVIKALPLEQKQEWNQYLDEMIATNLHDSEQIAGIVEHHVGVELEKRLGDSDLEDAINSHIGSYAWDSDDDWKDAVREVISDEMEDFDVQDAVREVISDEMEDFDVQDAVKNCFRTSNVLEDAVRDYPSNFREAMDFDNAVYKAIRNVGDINQEIRNICNDWFKDNINLEIPVKHYLESAEGRATVQSAIDEAVSSRMRSVLEALARNI